MSNTLFACVLRFSRQTKQSGRDRTVKPRVYFLTRFFSSFSSFFILCFHSTALLTQYAPSHRGSQPGVKQGFIRLTLHRGLLPQSGSVTASINSLARLLEPCCSCLYLLIPSPHLSIHPAPFPTSMVSETQADTHPTPGVYGHFFSVSCANTPYSDSSSSTYSALSPRLIFFLHFSFDLLTPIFHKSFLIFI